MDDLTREQQKLLTSMYKEVDLFSHEMINEIYHSSADELSKDELVNAVHEVASTVLKTYEAQTKR